MSIVIGLVGGTKLVVDMIKLPVILIVAVGSGSAFAAWTAVTISAWLLAV
ncbi:hypothetical protein [Bosea sp. LjRoot237]